MKIPPHAMKIVKMHGRWLKEFSDWLIDRFIFQFIYSWIFRWIDQLIDWLIDWLINWLDWLIDWLDSSNLKRVSCWYFYLNDQLKWLKISFYLNKVNFYSNWAEWILVNLK